MCASLSGTRRHYARLMRSWQIAEIWPAAAWNGGAARRQAACRHTCGVFTLTILSISALVRRLISLICRAAHPSVVSFHLSVVSSRRSVEQRTDLPFLLADLSNSALICRSFSPIYRAAHRSVVPSRAAPHPVAAVSIPPVGAVGTRAIWKSHLRPVGAVRTRFIRRQPTMCDMEIAPTAGRRCPNPLHSSPTDDVRYGNRTYGRTPIRHERPRTP